VDGCFHAGSAGPVFCSLAECFAFKGWRGIGNYKFLAILALSIMAVLYYIFQ